VDEGAPLCLPLLATGEYCHGGVLIFMREPHDLVHPMRVQEMLVLLQQAAYLFRLF